MSTVFKALTRPALIRGLGVPAIPFVIMCVGVVLFALWTYDFCYFLIVPLWFLMKRATDKDARFFDIIGLRILLNGNLNSNRRFSSLHYSGSSYDDVDISKVDKFMKLTDQKSFEELIPYSSHIGENIITTKKKDFIATWEIDGVFFECADDDNLEILTDNLNTLIRSFEGRNVTFYTHRARCKKKVTRSFSSKSEIANELMTEYYASLGEKDYYDNRLFLSVVFSPFTIEDKIDSKLSKKNKESDKLKFKEAFTEMEDISDRLNSYLSRFHAKRLGLYEENNRVFSSQLSLFQFLLSGKWQKIAVTNSPIYSYLGGKDVFFGNDAAQISAGQDNRYFRSLEIKDYFSNTETGIFDALMHIPVEYVFTSTFETVGRQQAAKAITDQLEKLDMTGDAAESQKEDLLLAQDMLASGLISFGKCHQTLVIYSESPEQLVKDTNIVVNTLQELGLVIAYSTLSLGAAFFAQLPANKRYRPRVSQISSLNFAEMEPFHNIFSGKKDGNTWGNSVITAQGSGLNVYNLNYHMTNDYQNFFGKNPTLGHTEILGSSNSGKTLGMMLQAFAAQQFGMPESFPPNKKVKKMTTVFFDKDRAAEVGIRAMGGDYYKVAYGEKTGWNPFAAEPTKRNIKMMKDLIALICAVDDTDPSGKRSISEAVDQFLSNADKRYPISAIKSLISEPNDRATARSGLKTRLDAWTSGKEYGWVFDNDTQTDGFDVSEKDVFGIDGTEFLEDKVTAKIIPFYLIYKVTQLADGRRLLIYIDEFWQWLLNDGMSDFIFNVLKTGRKLDMTLVVATQSPEEIIKSPIAAALREQCATHIFLSNQKAVRSDYVDKLQIAPQYYDKIKSINPLSRNFLVVKNPQRKEDTEDFAAFARFELGKATKYAPLLSASKDQLEIFDSIYKEGMEPKEWVHKFLKLANAA